MVMSMMTEIKQLVKDFCTYKDSERLFQMLIDATDESKY